MPLVRFSVRNEYALGHPELYKEANKEDPKAVLDGVAVAGLVGILRQLGDLAEFAGEVFHDLQEQVMTTASRSHKLMVRVQHIEAALPPLEKAVLAQTSHIHFAYTAGSEWHPRIRNEQNHFVYNDLPRFIMDSYEECRDPPHLHLLDKFDAGGHGSCLKRYSDPTFFKRVSGGSIETTVEKSQRDKKTRKSKKKRSSQRNGEISRVASISTHSGRFHIYSQPVNGRTSSQTASTIDMTLKSDFGDHSNSFDSRTGSGYIEVLNLGSSLQPGQQEPRESTSSFMQHIDTLDSVYGHESSQIVDDNFPCSSSQEQIGPSSSCVTWDEKVEIVEPKGLKFDGDEDPEVVSANFDIDTQEQGTANLGNVDQTDILLSDEDTSEQIFNTNQLEVESEPDNYVDALNTIESESENDIDCQTKREVKQYSTDVINDTKEEGIPDIQNDRKERGIHGYTASDHSPSIIESHIAPDVSPINGMPCTLHNPVPSESIIFEQKPQISGKSSDSDHSPGTDVGATADILDVSQAESIVIDGPQVESVVIDDPQAESLGIDVPQAESLGIDVPQANSLGNDGPQAESVISNPSSSGSRVSCFQNQSPDKIISSFSECQQPRSEFSGVQSVTFWTNGGLLGLEPSKPPAFAVSNAAGQDFPVKAKSETTQKGKLDTLVESAENLEAILSSSNEKVPVPLAYSDDKVEKASGSQNSINHGYKGGLNATAVAASGTELAPDFKATSTEANRENDGNTSVVFGLGHRLLVNGFRRKLPLLHDEKSEPVGSLLTGVLDQCSRDYCDANQTISRTTFTEQFGHGSPLDSLTSSPPLEHMKISFNPIDGLETSKLKLKFPDGTHCHESIRDMFASFQLVPESAIPLHDYGSDSDADTFCRSSPYMSDDCLSHQSESNSEQWESDESPGRSKDHELYDALRRMSSMEAVSSSLQVEGTAKNGMHVDHAVQNVYMENGAEPCLSSLDLPSFDAVNPLPQGETKSISDPRSLHNLVTEATPLPPPLPPVQWRVLKPHTGVAEDEQYTVSEPFKHALDLERVGSTIYQQPEQAPTNQLTKKENITNRESKQEDQQKFDRHKEANQDTNSKGLDEKEDFLHQIRTKSFSLRPTVTAKPTLASGPATNVKVTAILEKANAIRQAVGSDDGEDEDNWSDT